PAGAETFVVTTAANSGAGSLRDAITAANATPGADVIRFDIPGAGVHLLPVPTPLPDVTAPLTINGSTQPGFGGQPLIQLAKAGSTATGLTIAAGAGKVQGLSITGFATGIRVTGANVTVSGCWLGLDPAGLAAGNQVGVLVTGASATGAVIGGTSPAARNVISANTQAGITIAAPGTKVQGNLIGTDTAGRVAVGNLDGIAVVTGGTNAQIGGAGAGAGNVVSGNEHRGIVLATAGNVVQGNDIGVSASGKSRLANGEDGIRVDAPSPGNTIGGTSADARNVISGNADNGVHLESSSSNVVEGNYVGTDATGSYAIRNGVGGILVAGGSDNRVGGTVAGARNIISAQREGFGVELDHTTRALVEGNFVGVDAAGTSVLGNEQGVLVTGGSGNTIGGTGGGAGNVISGNLLEGVAVQSVATGTKIQGNLIGPAAAGAPPLGNGGAGIALRNTTADTVGGDAGGNTIVANGAQGVVVDGQTGPTTGIAIRGNGIFDNATGGIALLHNGNDLQAAPTLSSVTTSAGTTTVGMHAAVVAGERYTVDVFASPTCDPVEPAQGNAFVGTKTFRATITGVATVAVAIAALAAEQGVTATLTPLTTTDTSPFSACLSAP